MSGWQNVPPHRNCLSQFLHPWAKEAFWKVVLGAWPDRGSKFYFPTNQKFTFLPLVSTNSATSTLTLKPPSESSGLFCSVEVLQPKWGKRKRRSTWTGQESLSYRLLPRGKPSEEVRVRSHPPFPFTTSVPPCPWWLGSVFPEDALKIYMFWEHADARPV